MKYYLIAGEASGDLHGSNLMHAIFKKDPDATFRFWGGDKMQAEGGYMVKHYRDTAYMGFAEVVRNLPSIFRNLSRCKSDIINYQPDALILIDYPGFNIRIAEWVRNHTTNIKIIYYISPQVWAWKAKRAHKLKAFVDRMFVILPFEKAFYKDFDFEVTYVGHPLLDELEKLAPDATFRKRHQLSEKPIIALLPGSRIQEVDKHLELMINIAPQFDDFQIVVAGVSTVPVRYYAKLMSEQKSFVQLVVDDTKALLQHAEAAAVASGTATLETALIGVPQVVCYKGSYLSYLIFKRLIHVKYISLVNLILDQVLVTELIQNDFTTKRLITELNKVLEPSAKKYIQDAYKQLYQILGGPGASDLTAAEIIDEITPIGK